MFRQATDLLKRISSLGKENSNSDPIAQKTEAVWKRLGKMGLALESKERLEEYLKRNHGPKFTLDALSRLLAAADHGWVPAQKESLLERIVQRRLSDRTLSLEETRVYQKLDAQALVLDHAAYIIWKWNNSAELHQWIAQVEDFKKVPVRASSPNPLHLAVFNPEIGGKPGSDPIKSLPNRPLRMVFSQALSQT